LSRPHKATGIFYHVTRSRPCPEEHLSDQHQVISGKYSSWHMSEKKRWK
jgi:hypothetical protein